MFVWSVGLFGLFSFCLLFLCCFFLLVCFCLVVCVFWWLFSLCLRSFKNLGVSEAAFWPIKKRLVFALFGPSVSVFGFVLLFLFGLVCLCFVVFGFWSVGWLFGCLVGGFVVCLFVCLLVWLVSLLVGLLASVSWLLLAWLSVCFVVCFRSPSFLQESRSV